MAALTIHPYHWPDHEAAAHRLWMGTLGAHWPLTRTTFHQATVEQGPPDSFQHFVATQNRRIAGFILAQVSPDHTGSLHGGILALAVAEESQHQGIGSALLNHTVTHLRSLGVMQLYLGCGGQTYFWPGVPENLPQAVAFFRQHGWHFPEILYDMVGDLRQFAFNPAWLDRIHKQGFSITTPTAAETEPLLAFERTHFPDWTGAFVREINARRLHNLLIAVDQAGQLVGSATLFCEADEIYKNGLVWRAVLGQNLGGFGVLGVAETMRNQGIGLALAAEATRHLQARDVHCSFVGWTYLEEFYGRLGYRIWRRYHMSEPLILNS
jgi:beta-N-acetylhexosaminidase